MAVRKPLPLWFGLWVGYVVTMLFLIGYQTVGQTTTRGWLATLAAAFELWGVALVASPELRPIAERAAAAAWKALRTIGQSIWTRMRQLLGIRRTHTIHLGAALELSAAMGAEVRRGRQPPSTEATLEEKVAYLLAQEERHLKLINDLENRLRKDMDAMREELEGTATQLREHTSVSVREAAEAELRMRLLGVAFVIAGIVLAYAASLA